jgi:hypothetical protein
MTYNKYLEVHKKLVDENRKIFNFDFNGQKPIEFFKIEVFHVVIEKDHMHTFGGKPEWTKNFVNLIGDLCGVKSKMISSDKISKYSFVSSYESRRRNPSGDHSSEEGTYEFDAEIRVEKEYWKERMDYPDNQKKWKYVSEAHKMHEISSLAVLGRSKADTGAEKRAVIKLLRFPKPDFKMIETHIFCFRCEPDMDNQDARRNILNGGSHANSIFGTPSISGPAETAKKESDDITVTSGEVELEAMMDDIKDQKALHKLAGIILDNKSNIEEFLVYVNGYSGMSQEDQVTTLIGWISRYETVLKMGSLSEQRTYLVNWGK